MTNVKTLGIAAVALALFAVPMAFASADINLQSFGFKVNGNTSSTIQPGDDFEITVNADVNDGDEVEFFRIRLIDTDNNIVSTDCQAVGRVRDVNDRNVRFNTETPSDIPNGMYDVQLLPFGIGGEAQSNGCDLDNDFPGSQETYQNRLFVDDGDDVVGTSGNGGSGSGSGSSVSQWDQIIAMLNALLHPSTPAPIGKCAELNTKLMGTVDDEYNGNNAVLQDFLMDNGASIPALAPGSRVVWGYKGDQTRTAISWFKSVNSCI